MDDRGPHNEGAPIDPLDISMMDKASELSECWNSTNSLGTLSEHHHQIKANNNNNNNRLLYLTVEYVEEQSRDYSRMFPTYEQVIYSPRPNSPLSDFEHRVSPLDPNMSSTARYSPTPVQLPQIQYQNSVVVLQDQTSPIIVHETDDNQRANINFINQQNSTQTTQSNVNDVEDFNVDNTSDTEELVSSVANELILMQSNNNELETTTAPLMLTEIPGTDFTLARDFLVMHDEQLNVMSSLRNQNNEITNDDTLVVHEELMTNEKTNLLEQNIINIDDIQLKIDDDNLIVSKTQTDGDNKNTKVKLKHQINDKKTFRCDDCNAVCLKVGECSCQHNVCTIADQPVPSRAIATLPGSYLSITKIQTGNVCDNIIYGVFAKRNIRRRTQFGPIEGIVCTYDGKPFLNCLPLLYETNVYGEFLKIDVSNENSSNWMRFVRPACYYKEQNLIICQQNDGIFFLTTKNILPNEELKAGPSFEYALRRNLKILEPDINENTIIHDKNINLQCFDCNEYFNNSEILKNHLLNHDNNNNGETSKNKNTNENKLFKIIDGQTTQNIYTCPHCRKIFPRSYSLKRHMIIHKNLKNHNNYQCNECNEIFINSQKLLRHIKLIHNDNKEKENSRKLNNECKICNLIFDKLPLLNLHMIQHNKNIIDNKNKQLHCPECNIEFNYQNDLIKHITKLHGKKIKQSKTTQKNKTKNDNNNNILSSHKCTMCYKRFATKVRLQQHYLVHGSDDKKPLPCNICFKRFMNNSALSCHLKTHCEDKQIFECPMCRKLFNQILQLKDHIETHRNDDNTFNCPYCLRQKFLKYSVIRKHILAYHCERKHKCQYCSKTFPTIDKLRMHLLRHSDYREFKCNECYSQFKRKDKLKEHMTRMHNSQRIIKREQQQQQKSQQPQQQQQQQQQQPQQQQQCTQGNNVNNNINISNNNNNVNNNNNSNNNVKKFIPKVNPTDYNRFIYKCHTCLVGFKRRGMLVNHLAKRHPDVLPESIPELNLPILRQTRDYYCQYCDKVYKSSSKRKAHIMKNHPGQTLPPSNRQKDNNNLNGLENSTYCQTVGSITTIPHNCQWCHKQYASKAKLLQHQRKKHSNLMEPADKIPRQRNRPSDSQNQPPIKNINNNNVDDEDDDDDEDENNDNDNFIKTKIIKADDVDDVVDNNIDIIGGQFVRMRDIR
ncbi:hypothetical protein HCN44_005000 [Aphidius gifuensis]|uniref:Uncharacterized protein n=1 Tax=Aphidius gifuensis TaxID=684658 RepID=A0A834XXK6_APHGI|nr:PR domain zinc finger protein 10-like [Aphidius gifuensis]KAF7992656.1 hypothetical protein HCN44_005000 [Aphidius gifuensis]